MTDNILSTGKQVIQDEVSGLQNLYDNLNESFVEAVDRILTTKGKVIVSGVGKSGAIGRKFSSTLNSTGTPSVYLDPIEGLHGEFGVVSSDDVVIAISYSGSSRELTDTLPFFIENGNFLIGITGAPRSPLGDTCDLILDICTDKEACPLNLAPTISTCNTLCLGDALAITLMKVRGFSSKEFSRIHPNGRLGFITTTTIDRLMDTNNLPLVLATDSMSSVIPTMTRSAHGIAIIVDEKKIVTGVITDGDLRRGLECYPDLLNMRAADLMSSNPVSVLPSLSVADADILLHKNEVNALLVLDDEGRLSGLYAYYHSAYFNSSAVIS